MGQPSTFFLPFTDYKLPLDVELGTAPPVIMRAMPGGILLFAFMSHWMSTMYRHTALRVLNKYQMILTPYHPRTRQRESRSSWDGAGFVCVPGSLEHGPGVIPADLPSAPRTQPRPGRAKHPHQSSSRCTHRRPGQAPSRAHSHLQDSSVDICG
ncbi:unnamed protein product [Mycena citricolor]|uniref:Uncharacterized protein n=1 Tax=Mycena citricolor TaxID=2018698 RepID=A0AAD2GVW7_9AGAR|nr:unnamed protein product [Mycena citricolor]